MEKNPFLKMREKWPSSVVARTQVGRFSGGTLNGRYLANLDSLGEGPEGRIRVGRKVCYPVDSLIRFLEQRLEILSDQKK